MFATGMLDLIRIRREGYPVHVDFNTFVNSYKCLCKKVRFQSNNAKDMSCTILKTLNYSSKEWQVIIFKTEMTVV